jgi:hypothetical protein
MIGFFYNYDYECRIANDILHLIGFILILYIYEIQSSTQPKLLKILATQRHNMVFNTFNYFPLLLFESSRYEFKIFEDFSCNKGN